MPAHVLEAAAGGARMFRLAGEILVFVGLLPWPILLWKQTTEWLVASLWWSIFLLGGLIHLYKAGRHRRILLRILREGLTAVGVVTRVDCNKRFVIAGDRKPVFDVRAPWTIEYEFEAEGRKWRSRSRYLSVPQDLERGAIFRVVFLPGQPERNTLWISKS